MGMPMPAVWSPCMEDMLVPATLPPAKPDADTTVSIELLCRASTSGARASQSSVVAEDGIAPNPYGRLTLLIGDRTQSFDTPVLKHTYSPTWAAGAASHDFALHSISKEVQVTLQIVVLDNDFGRNDKQ